MGALKLWHLVVLAVLVLGVVGIVAAIRSAIRR
jgi:hypothetical protein